MSTIFAANASNYPPKSLLTIDNNKVAIEVSANPSKPPITKVIQNCLTQNASKVKLIPTTTITLKANPTYLNLLALSTILPELIPARNENNPKAI